MLTEFQDQLIAHITSTGNLGGAERHLLETENAKYVRPVFVFACGEALGIAPKQLMNEASAVELMHTATLLHDDIIDEATERRGKPSVNAAYGNKLAVLAGDGLLAKSLALLLQTAHPDKAVGRAGETLLGMTEAVAIEIEAYKDPARVTEAQLLEVIDGKTGSLFALCGYIAGLAAHKNDAADAFAHVGVLMGRVFQINDDIADIDEDRASQVTTIPTLVGEAAAQAQITAAVNAITATVEALQLSEPAKKQFLHAISGIIRQPL